MKNNAELKFKTKEEQDKLITAKENIRLARELTAKYHGFKDFKMTKTVFKQLCKNIGFPESWYNYL